MPTLARAGPLPGLPPGASPARPLPAVLFSLVYIMREYIRGEGEGWRGLGARGEGGGCPDGLGETPRGRTGATPGPLRGHTGEGAWWLGLRAYLGRIRVA